MKLQSLHDLYITELHDLYDAENQILKALPKMIESSTAPELRRALEEHLEQTRGHVGRLEEVFSMHGEKAKGETSDGIEGIVKAGKKLMSADAEPQVRDAAIISAAQKVEHYEMAAYGCVRTYAKILGMKDAEKLLQKTLDEEAETDEKLTMLDESTVNLEAAEGDTVGAGSGRR